MSTRNLTAVEGLRFFLFLGIFVFHCVSRWLPLGWGGVEAFLVIASYFLTSKYLKRERAEIKVGEAFLHRIKRLYPLYIVLILFFSLGTIVIKNGLSFEPLWYIFSLQNFRCLFENATYSLDPFIGHFWYIGLDVWLFLIWVLLLRLVPTKHLRKAFVISLIIGILWRTLFILIWPNNPSISYMIPIGQLDSWAIGGLVALNVHEKGKEHRIVWTEIVIGLIGIIALTLYNAHRSNCGIPEAYQLWHSSKGYMLNPITGNIHLFIAILTAGTLRYCISTENKHRLLSSAPLVALGGMTYELYCLHYPIQYFVKYFIHNELLIMITAIVVTCLVVLLWDKLAMPVVKRLLK